MPQKQELSLLDAHKDVIEHHISPYLSLVELRNAARAYKTGNFFLKPFQIRLFLQLVAFGKQEEAEIMLKKYPMLALQSGWVKDYSGRIFKDITAFQYALWALDRHMWSMLLKYLSKPVAKKQLQDHISGKKTYIDNHGSHYDFVPLIDALQTYIDGFNGWSNNQRIEFWCNKVGGAQCRAPVHVANEYCRLDRSFDVELKFNEKKLPRSLSIYNYHTNETELWFPLSANKGLGIDLAVFRGNSTFDFAWLFTPPAWAVLGTKTLNLPSIDLAAVIALCKVRTQEFVQLKEYLLNDDLIQEKELGSKLEEKSSFCVML